MQPETPELALQVRNAEVDGVSQGPVLGPPLLMLLGMAL